VGDERNSTKGNERVKNIGTGKSVSLVVRNRKYKVKKVLSSREFLLIARNQRY